MVLLVRHSGEIIRGRTGPTRERNDQFTRAKKLRCGGLSRDCRALRAVPPAGLPLPAASPASGFAFAGSGRESRLYRQTSAPINCAGPAASPTTALLHQFLGRASLASRSGPTQMPWLNPGASEACVAKFTIYPTVTSPRKCRRFIAGWYLRRRPERPQNAAT